MTPKITAARVAALHRRRQNLTRLRDNKGVGSPLVAIDEWEFTFVGTAKADKHNNKLTAEFLCNAADGLKFLDYLIAEIDAELTAAGVDPAD